VSTSSPPRMPATGLIPVEWRHPRRRWVRIGVVLLALVVAMLACQVVRKDGGPGLVGQATVTASSTQIGYDPHGTVDSGDARAPRAEWRSKGETVGAWIELSWPEKHDLQQVVLVRNSVAEPGVTAGFLSFGDGSQLQVTLSATSTETTIPFASRSVDKLRFTASAVGDGAHDVQIAEILVATSSDDGVADDDAPGGNVAVDASISGAGDTRALHDGVDGGIGTGWTVDSPVGASVLLNWVRPEEIAAVEIVGATGSTATVSGATLSFGDGARLPVGAVLANPQRPSLIGFMPRVSRSLRLTVDRTTGTGPLTIGELRVYRRGATPARTPAAVSPTAPVEDGACPAPGAPTGKLVVSCPVNGSAADGVVAFRVSAPGYSAVTATAWPADEADPSGPPVQAVPDPMGNAELAVDMSSLPPGPVTVRFEATGSFTVSATAYFQLYRRGPGGADVASSAAAAGRTLIYAEEFDRPISITRNGAGADYAAAKPVHDGAEDFGDAIFADPAQGFDNVRVVDDRYLRIDVEPNPPGYVDPQGWGRTHLGGMLASARPGGSGFSAQYGYFEARMLTPAAPGTWPAFWMLPSDNLAAPTPAVAEIDAVEFYGHNPTGACHATHDYNSPRDDGVARCGTRFDSDRSALSWHRYGVSVLPSGITFYIDGQVVATAPQVDDGGAPMFFLVNLALGGGWPVDLGAVQDRATLYVDYVRVYV
jgi:Glycosyl hydrolases family 16